MFMKWLFIIIFAVFVIWFFYSLFTSKPIPLERENLFIGGVKCGKTGTASVYMLRWFKSRYRSYILSFVRHPFNKEKRKPKPYVYSSIPLKLPYCQKARSLTEDYLLMEKLLPTECTSVFFDEVGQVANQYDYDFEAVKVNIQTFIRFYGHFIKDGYVFTTEQASDFIAKPIRARFNCAVEVKKFHRCLFFPLGKVKWQSIKITNDVMNTKDVSEDSWNTDFFIFPYGRRYDPRAYSEAYALGFTHERPPEEWDCKVSMKTRYLPDVRRAPERSIFSPVAGDSQEGNGCEAPSPLGNPGGEESAEEMPTKDEAKNEEFPLLDITDIINSLSFE